MANEPRAPASEAEANRLLREEVQLQKQEHEEREAREQESEQLKNRVSVAAIILTTALSFIGNVKSDRSDAVHDLRAASERARTQGAELWAYYQAKAGQRTALVIARDRLRNDLARRGLTRDDPEAKMDAFQLASYEERLRDFDVETQRVFFRVQDLEQAEDLGRRRAVEPDRAVFRFELGGKLITLALILLSVTILSGKRWLLWAGVALGSVGLLVAFDGYFLFL